MNYNDVKTASFIAYKTIRKSQKSTVILLVSILSLAFFNLIFVSGFLSGFSNGVLLSMINSDTAHISIMPQEKPTVKSFIVNQGSIRKDIETIPGIESTTGRYVLAGSVAYDKQRNGTFKYVSAPIIGVNPVDEKRVLKVHENIVEGSYPDELRDDEILLGANLAGGFGTVETSNLGGVHVGDKVDVTYANGTIRNYTVKGIFQITIGFVSNAAFVSKKEAETILTTQDNASEILIRVDLKRESLESYVSRIQSMAPTLHIEDYTKRLSAVGILIDAFDSIAVIVSAITIVVAAITIFVMIYINAVSKRRQIGILKAIGIHENIIELSYVFQSLFYAVLGIFGGLILLFFIVQPYLVVHPIIMPFGSAKLLYTRIGIIIDIIALLGAAVIAGLVPARTVTRAGILETIWG